MRSRWVLASSTGDSFFAAMSRAASAMVRIDISFCSTSKVSAGSASRGSGAFTRAISALEDHGAGQESLHLVRRQGEPGPLQHGVEFGFVDRGRHGHSFRLPEGAR